MDDDPRVTDALERMLDSGLTPEEACRDCPELIDEVRTLWQHLGPIDAELQAAFPEPGAAPGAAGLPEIAGYEVEGVLGHGGMGVVYRARHLRLNRPVALKMLLSGPYAVPEESKRLLREAEAVAALHHPNVVPLYDCGELDGRPYFTMELVEGGTLGQRLSGTPLPAREAAALAAALADAVQSAHAAGIVHRDLKPSNVLMAADGTPKVADFGLARRVGVGSELTRTGAALGTPSYMAPEQALGQPAGPAADIYALGAILYECLTGRPPFKAESALETLQQVTTQEVAPPSRLNARVPRDMETICLKCLEKEPNRRYPSAAALADDLRRFGRGDPIVARPPGAAERVARWVRRRPTLAAAVAAGVLLTSALVVGVLWWYGQRTALEATAVAYAEADLDESERLRDMGEFKASAAVLQRARDRLREYVPPELRDRLATAVANLELVTRLEAIRLRRSVLFINEARTFNRERSDRDYDEAFRAAGLGADQEMAEPVVARVSGSPVRKALVAALDDWASCTADPGRRAWLLAVARLADPDPWRNRARDAPVWEDRVKLTELTDAAPVQGQPLTLLLAVGEQLQLAGGDARPFLWRVQMQHPNDFWANRALGDALYLRGEHALSVGFFRMALALRPDTAVANHELGDVLLCTGRVDEAVFYLERALEIEPLSARNHIYLADALSAQGKPDEADSHYREALRLVPETTLGRRSVAIALERSRREDEARALYEQNVQLNPRDEQCRRDLALHLARRGRLDEAAAQFRAAIDINPKSVTAHADLGRLLQDMRRPDEAAACFRAALAINPQSVMALHDMGSLLLRTGRPHEAVDYLRQGADLEPFNGLIQADLRAALIRQGRLEEARAAWRKALDAGPPEHDAWFGYAELCLFLGHEDEYRRHRRDLIGRFGDSKTLAVCERTGRACLLLPAPEGELEQAVALTERAAAASGANPYCLFAQGLARYRQDRFEDAIKLMSGGAAPVMGPSPRLILSMAQYQKGQKDHARTALAAAVASHDWDAARATNHDAWIAHIVRREAEALIGAVRGEPGPLPRLVPTEARPK